MEYDHLRRLVFPTLGANADPEKKEGKDREMRSNQIFEEEIEKKLNELRLPREAPAKCITFKSDHKHLMREFKNLIDTKKIEWYGRRDVRTGSQGLSDQTLEKNCVGFIHALSAGGGGSGDAISTKVLYDLDSFLEKICCTKSSRDNDYLAASTLSLRLRAVRNVMNKHPDIPIGEHDENTLYHQYEALGEIAQIVDRVVRKITERRFKTNYFDFDYDDVLDAIAKIYDGKWALEERQLICEFGSRSELSSIVLVHDPKEGVVQKLLDEGHSVIVIESKSPIDEKKNYSDIETALPEGLKISIRKRHFINKDTETRTIFTHAGEQDQTIARILLGIYVAETKQHSSSDVVHLLKALDKRGFDGKYSWPYRIFRLIQEFGCRDDLGTVQIACNPTQEQMKKFDEERANLVIISTKDGKDLPKKVNFLKRYVLPAGIKVAVSLMAHKTAAENSLTPVREIESEDVIRMIIDIFLTERLYEDVNRPFFLIPRVPRLVNLRTDANFGMSYLVSEVLENLKSSGDVNVKEEYTSTTFLRKLLASSEFHKGRLREFEIRPDGSEIEKLHIPPTIDGVLLNAHAFKMYHSLLMHIEYYLRLIFKAWKAKVDLAKHHEEAEIQQIRSKWNTYIKGALVREKKRPEGESNPHTGKSYFRTEVELMLDGCEGGYLGSPKPPLRELTGDARSARLLAVFESMLKLHGLGEGALKKRDVAEKVVEKLNALEENRLAGVERESKPVVQVINQSIIIERFKFIVEGVNDVFGEESERAINIQKAFIRQGFTFHLADNPKAGASGSKEKVPTDFFHAFKQIAVKVWEYWMIKHKTWPKNLQLSDDEKDEGVEEFLKHYVKERDRNPGLTKKKQKKKKQ